MKYGIAWEDLNGKEYPRLHYGLFSSFAKAKAYAKQLNEGICVQGHGKFVVIEL